MLFFFFPGFQGGSGVKNPPANAGGTGDIGLILGLGRSPGGGNGNPLQYSCLGNHMDRGAWWFAKNQTWLSTCTASFKKKLFIIIIFLLYNIISTWIRHGCTRVPNPEPPSHLPRHMTTFNFFDPVDCSPPSSSVHGMFQARILEWLPFPPPGDLPNPGIEPLSVASNLSLLCLLHWQADSLSWASHEADLFGRS